MPNGFDEKVEWVDPGGNREGEIKDSCAHNPEMGFSPFVIAFPKTTMFGFTPKQFFEAPAAERENVEVKFT